MIEKKYYKDAFERIDEDRKNKILEIGIEEFSMKGFENANINIIAKNAGISIGLMYKYFSTKEDLFMTCLIRGMNILEEALVAIMNSDDKLITKAENLIRAIYSHSKRHSNYIKMYNEICAEKNSLVRIKEIVEDIETKRSSIYIKTIGQALANGEVRADLDPRLFAYFLDNLMTTLQFSFTCDYYKEKLMIYTGVNAVEDTEEKLVMQLLKFIESAFTFEK